VSRMRILLISPSNNEKRSHFFRIPQLTLSVIAALTPPEIEVDIVEEETEAINFEKYYDLVGISCMTAVAQKAYQLAGVFRKKGAKVVLGGIHPTVMSQEAIQHCDSVVIGEAEGTWPQLIQDFKHNRLQKFYKSLDFDLANFPIPKKNSNHHKTPFHMQPIFTTRGCPYDCEFCSVTNLYGKKLRHRRVADVVEEITRTEEKKFIFLDDNIVGDVKFAKELFASLSSLKISWVGQASMSLVKDENLLLLAKKSGCMALFFGLESVSSKTLEDLPKTLRSLKKHDDAIKIIQGSGIMFHASVVFGFDDDDSSIFERTLEFLMKNRIVTATFNILTPYPGTRIFEKFEKEGRLLSQNWIDYNHSTVVFKPKKMTPQQLAEGYVWIGRNFYSKSSILKRFFNNFNHPVLYLSMNAAYHRAYNKENSENRVTRS
jgi:radical SAM superfamily enzyme YgiQ (UPF0313 family)